MRGARRRLVVRCAESESRRTADASTMSNAPSASRLTTDHIFNSIPSWPYVFEDARQRNSSTSCRADVQGAHRTAYVGNATIPAEKVVGLPFIGLTDDHHTLLRAVLSVSSRTIAPSGGFIVVAPRSTASLTGMTGDS